MIDTPVYGTELSFEEKLQHQLKGTDPAIWRMIADIYFVYFLPSTFITLEKKIHDVHWAAESGGFQAPPKNADIWKIQEAGYTRTSMKYHTKYAQFWLIILFAFRMKQSSDQDKILSDPMELQTFLDEILQAIRAKTDRAYDMRHAILYMTFPDQYERIISTRDKERILETYRDQLDEIPEDLDRALREIREVLPEKREDLGLNFDFYIDIRDEWRPKKRPSKVHDEDVEEITREVKERERVYSIESSEVIENILGTLAYSKNIILYGPPGTGKTFFAKKVAEILAKPRTGEGVSRAVRLQEVAEQITFHELLALGMFLGDPGERYTVPELEKLPIIEARFIISPVKHPKNQIWAYLQAHTSIESETVKISRRSEPYLFDKDEQSHWFLTELGKAYVQETLSEEIQQLTSPESSDGAREDFIDWVTFHQSYSYEEFIEGLRPISSDEEPSTVTYEVVPGAFKRIATKAAADSGNNYVLIIDEINRGNIAKIFGELITLIEDDKRAGESNALSIALAYTPNRSFSVPSNLYIIGTMNTADRSIALLDVALRRRFAFEEIMPEPKLLDGVLVESSEEVVDLGELLRSLNEKITASLDRDHQIGHSYFLKVRDGKVDEQVEILEYVWNHQVFPLLQEYFYSQPEELLEILSPMYPDVGIRGEDITIGGTSYEFETLSGDDLLFALSALAKARSNK